MPMLSEEIPAGGRRRGWVTLGLSGLTTGGAIALAGMGYIQWANTLPAREPDPRPPLLVNGFTPGMAVAGKLKQIPIFCSETQWLVDHAKLLREASPAELAALDELRAVARLELRIPKDGDGQ